MVSAQSQTQTPLSYADRAKKGTRASVPPPISASSSSTAPPPPPPSSLPSTATSALPSSSASATSPLTSQGHTRPSTPPPSSSAPTMPSSSSTTTITSSITSTTTNEKPAPVLVNGVNGHDTSALSPTPSASASSTIVSPPPSATFSTGSASKQSTPPKQNVWAVRKEQMQQKAAAQAAAAAAQQAQQAAAQQAAAALTVGTNSVPSTGTNSVSVVSPLSAPSLVPHSPPLSSSSPTLSPPPKHSLPRVAAPPPPPPSLPIPPALPPSTTSAVQAFLGQPPLLHVPPPPQADRVAVASAILRQPGMLPPTPAPVVEELAPAGGNGEEGKAESVLGDAEAWPEVGQSLQGRERNGKEREEKEVEGSAAASTSGGSRKGEKTKWVHIPPSELQAAADALQVSSSSSRSRERSPHTRPGPPSSSGGPNANSSSRPARLSEEYDALGRRRSGNNGNNGTRSAGGGTGVHSAQRSRRGSSSTGMRTGPGSGAPSPVRRNVNIFDHPLLAAPGQGGLGLATPEGALLIAENVLVRPAVVVPAPAPTRRKKKASRPSTRAAGVRMPKKVDGEERRVEQEVAERWVFGNPANGQEEELAAAVGTGGNEAEVVVVKQRGRFGIGVTPPPVEGAYTPSGYGSSNQLPQFYRMDAFAPRGAGGGGRLEFGASTSGGLSGLNTPEMRSVLGLAGGDLDIHPNHQFVPGHHHPQQGQGQGHPQQSSQQGSQVQPSQHVRSRSSLERGFDGPPSGPGGPPLGPRAERYGNGFGGRGQRGRGGGMGSGGQRGMPYGRGGAYRGGPGFRNGYAPPPYPPPLPGMYDPQAGSPEHAPEHPYAFPPPPPPHAPNMQDPNFPPPPPGAVPYPGAMAPWMMGPSPQGYIPPPPQFVPPYGAAPPFAPQPGPNGMYGMPGTVPVPTPVTMVGFPLDPLRYFLLGQVEYYFSAHNLVNDVFLRNQMDAQGWVDIGIIASFNRMRSLTLDYGLIKETMGLSALIEVQGDKVRLSNGAWDQFIMHRTPRAAGGEGATNGEGDSLSATTTTAPSSETASAATTLSVQEEEGERKAGEEVLAAEQRS